MELVRFPKGFMRKSPMQAFNLNQYYCYLGNNLRTIYKPFFVFSFTNLIQQRNF